MRWVITDDCVDGGQAVGVGNFPHDGALDELPYRFRLLDDDGEVYYVGRSDDQDSEAAFAPLDWATGYAGCTETQYRRDGHWETL